MRYCNDIGRLGNFLRIVAGAVLLISAFLVFTPVAHAEDADVKFDKVKAALIFKFINFVTWPEEAFESDDTPLLICIVENRTIYNELKKSARKLRTASRPVEITFKKEGDPLKSCHIIFIDESVSRKFYGRFNELHRSFVLTIGDDEKFAREGGIIRISENNNRPDLEVNIDSAKDSKLTISSQVLKLSKVVRNKDEK